ncbi:hypothetical protein Tco_0451772 [Tanacetum coccineum]
MWILLRSRLMKEHSINESMTAGKHWDRIQRAGYKQQNQLVVNAHAEDADIRPIYDEEPMAEWIPTGKILTSSTTKVDSEPTNGSNDDITNQYECKQTLDVSAGTLNIHAKVSSFKSYKEDSEFGC